MQVKIIQLDEDELENLVTSLLAKGFKQGAEWFKQENQTKEDSDIISKEEAMSLLGCSERTLTSLRTQKKITSYPATRPFRYSKKSCLKYLESIERSAS